MSEICTRLGGSKATLYNYFPSKEALFLEVMFQASEADFQNTMLALQAGTGRGAVRAFDHDAATQPGGGNAPCHARAAVAACGGGHHHHQRLGPLHHAACGVDDHGNGREQGRDPVLQAVHGVELRLPQQPEQGQQQDAQPAVEIAAIGRHRQHAHRGLGGRRLAARQHGAQLRAEGEQRRGRQQQPGHHAAEGGIRRDEQQRRARRTTDERQHHQQPHRQPRWRRGVFAKAPGPGDVAGQQGHGAGGIGHHGRHAGEDQGGQGEEAAASGHGIECTGHKRGSQQQGAIEHVFSRGRWAVALLWRQMAGS